jgi:hypothetical protein
MVKVMATVTETVMLAPGLLRSGPKKELAE